jgi:hypothetical protein
MIKFKANDWVLTTSGCIVQVLQTYDDDPFVAIRVDSKDVCRPFSRHAIVKVVPDPKILLDADVVTIVGKLQKPSNKTKNRPYRKKK